MEYMESMSPKTRQSHPFTIQGAVLVAVQPPEGGALLLWFLVGRDVALPELGQGELTVPIQVLLRRLRETCHFGGLGKRVELGGMGFYGFFCMVLMILHCERGCLLMLWRCIFMSLMIGDCMDASDDLGICLDMF